VSRPTLRYPLSAAFRIRGYHPLWLNFPEHSTGLLIDYGNWAVPRSLAATNRISVDFFSSGYLDVSVLRVRFCILLIQIQITLKESWVSPFGNLRINVYLPTPRSLSQTYTSFIASYCQGIHRMRLITYYTTLNDS
jgi:hypothetical protein